ncbi:MAG: hypothetical protein OEM76_13710 [Gammaproteobacteria bacterium]|nr:hypothetical protein [Gammaproteobacteria bacterium]
MAATTVLTGMLPFIVFVGAIIAFPLSLLLLNRYRATVLRTMAASGGVAPTADGVPDEQARAGDSGQLEIVTVEMPSVPLTTGSDDSLFAHVTQAPWATVRAYALGGVTYAAILGAAQLIADGSFSLLRFIAMTYIYAWPVIIAINLIVPSTRRLKIRSFGAYFVGLMLISILAVSVSTNLSFFGLFIAWALFSLAPTIVVLAFLQRRVRAVGVMVLAFTVIALAGTNIALAIAESSESLLRSLAGFAIAVGSNAVGAFVGIILIGAVAFGVIAWFANKWIKNMYLQKRLSDQSLLLDSMWLVFALVQAIGLAFVSAAWYLAGLVAFLAYKFTVMNRLKVQRPGRTDDGSIANILFLRVFSLGRRSEQVFDAVSAHWRYIGNVRMIAGPDLAVTTVEPHEFLEFLSGRIDESFIPSGDALEARMLDLDSLPDYDGRFRVNDFFCYDDTWKMVLSRLVRESDAVLMDVRGFSADNAGVIFELNELVNMVPIHRVVLIADRTTDTPFLNEVLENSWANMRPDSPNRTIEEAVLTICAVAPERAMEVPHVLRSLCDAARKRATTAEL